MALTNDNFVNGCEANATKTCLLIIIIRVKDILNEQNLSINFDIIDKNI